MSTGPSNAMPAEPSPPAAVPPPATLPPSSLPNIESRRAPASRGGWWRFDVTAPQWRPSPVTAAAWGDVRRYFRPGDTTEFFRRVAVALYGLGVGLMAVGAGFNLAVIQAGVIVAGIALVLWPLAGLRLRLSPVVFAMLLWIGAVLVSNAVNGLWWSEAQIRLERMWRLLALVVLLQVPIDLVKYRGKFFAAAVAVGIAAVGVAFWQHRSGLDFMFPTRDMREWYIASSDTYRASGFFDHPLTFAGVTTIFGVFAIALGLHAKSWRWSARIAVVAVGAVLLVGLLPATSRGYLVVAAAAMGALVLTLPYRWLALGGTALLFAVIVVAGRTDVQSRFGDNFVRLEIETGLPLQQDVNLTLNLAESDRAARWHFGAQTVAAYPLFGVGHHFPRYWNAFSTRADPWAKARRHLFRGYHLHNTYLHVAVETGLVGLLAFLSIFVFLFRELIVTAIRSTTAGPGHAGWPMAGAIALIAFLLGGLFEFNFDDTEVQLALWFLLGLALWPNTDSARSASARGPLDPSSRRRAWPATVPVLALYGGTMAVAALGMAVLLAVRPKFWITNDLRGWQLPTAAALLIIACVLALALAVVLRRAGRQAALPHG